MSNLKTKKEFANKKWTAQDAIYLMEVGAPSGYSERTMQAISETLGRSMGALKHMMLRIQAGKSKFQDPESNSGVYAKNFEKFVITVDENRFRLSSSVEKAIKELEKIEVQNTPTPEVRNEVPKRKVTPQTGAKKISVLWGLITYEKK
tara:strand:+ start:842 stop:1285 length:444 start_codon:yes stop_codon:yes gene_type:complete